MWVPWKIVMVTACTTKHLDIHALASKSSPKLWCVLLTVPFSNIKNGVLYAFSIFPVEMEQLFIYIVSQFNLNCRNFFSKNSAFLIIAFNKLGTNWNVVYRFSASVAAREFRFYTYFFRSIAVKCFFRCTCVLEASLLWYERFDSSATFDLSLWFMLLCNMPFVSGWKWALLFS